MEGEKEYIQAIEQLAEKYRVTLFFKGRYDLNQMVYNLLSNSYDATVFCSVCLTQKRLKKWWPKFYAKSHRPLKNSAERVVVGNEEFVMRESH